MSLNLEKVSQGSVDSLSGVSTLAVSMVAATVKGRVSVLSFRCYVLSIVSTHPEQPVQRHNCQPETGFCFAVLAGECLCSACCVLPGTPAAWDRRRGKETFDSGPRQEYTVQHKMHILFINPHSMARKDDGLSSCRMSKFRHKRKMSI